MTVQKHNLFSLIGTTRINYLCNAQNSIAFCAREIPKYSTLASFNVLRPPVLGFVGVSVKFYENYKEKKKNTMNNNNTISCERIKKFVEKFFQRLSCVSGTKQSPDVFCLTLSK